jgi:Family of unknown function (DUF6709)
MWDTLIGRQIRRSSRNLIIWNGLLLAGVIVFFSLTARCYYNFLFGPFPLDRDAVVKLKDDNLSEYFVTVESDFCQDTGVPFMKTGKRGRKYVGGRYLLLDMKDSWLVVKVGNNAAAEKKWTGTIANLSPEARSDLGGVLGFNRFGPQAGAKPLLPVMLDATGFRLLGYIGLAIAVPAGLLSVWNLFKGVSRLSNIEKHPLAQRLKKYGEPAEVAEKIQVEYDSQDRMEIGKATFTRSWMLHPTTFGVDSVFLGDAVWSYKSVTQHYHNGVPTGKTYTGHICDIHGSQVGVQLKNEQMCDEFVMAVAERVPWALIGFDKTREEMWKHNKPAIYEMAEQRRKDLMEDLRRQKEAPTVEEIPPDEVEPV